MSRQASFPYLFTLLWLAILALMIWAGFWQLDRSRQKQLIFDNLAQQKLYTPEDITSFEAIPNYLKTKLLGRYDYQLQFLLENKMHQGRIGFHVLTPFYAESIGAWIVVNRGWVESTTVSFPVEVTVQSIIGLKSDLPKVGIQLGETVMKNQAIQKIPYFDNNVVIPFLKSVLCEQKQDKNCIITPFMIKLDKSMQQGFIREWKNHMMTAQKHKAYAVQWFSMSLVLVLLYLIFLRKTNASKN
ncbi:MAG: SURF1 family protein [Proteobacteria bacterium]|nr:SURF1 family protein [Pseudomonadota bacterium]